MKAPRVAIVGSGPSGLYAAEELLKRGVRVDIVERLPTPFGLVRSGVAPDHPRIKGVTTVLERILAQPGAAFHGNVEVGRDVSVRELAAFYDGVILACGASEDATLGIAGEELFGSFGAGAFVGWYNGHPDHQRLRVALDGERAVVVGNGNVALDVARMLLSPPERLAGTDVAAHAQDILAGSAIREVHVLGRRGPVQASFAAAELREFARLDGLSVHVDKASLALDAACAAELAEPPAEEARKTMKLLQEIAEAAGRPAGRRLHLHFRAGLAAIDGAGGKVAGVTASRMRLTGPAGSRTAEPTGETFALACGLVVRSTGFRARPLEGVPCDGRGRVPNMGGRVTLSGRVLPGLYVTGWMKRGPSGVIGTNRACGQETARAVVDDLAGRPVRSDAEWRLGDLLAPRGSQVVSYDGWRRIDELERTRGTVRGKPREKLTSLPELLEASRPAPCRAPVVAG